VGATLKQFGVTTDLTAPTFKIYRSDGSLLGAGADWSINSASIAVFSELFDTVGAFALSPTTHEQVFIGLLPKGRYTIQCNSDLQSGEALLEFYALPFASVTTE